MDKGTLLFVLIFMIVAPCGKVYGAQNVQSAKSGNHKNQELSISRSSDNSVGGYFFARVTAYSSSDEETDSLPLITASGSRVHRGVVATNTLPFGTRIRIPDLFGEEVFVVEDRMSRRKRRHVDVWMESRKLAVNFGVRHARIIILN